MGKCYSIIFRNSFPKFVLSDILHSGQREVGTGSAVLIREHGHFRYENLFLFAKTNISEHRKGAKRPLNTIFCLFFKFNKCLLNEIFSQNSGLVVLIP